MEGLKRKLETAGYTEEGVLLTLGATQAVRSELPVYRRRLDDSTPLGALIRVFLLGDALAASRVPYAEELVAAGLAEWRAGELAAKLRLTPFAGLLLAHDAPDEELLTPDHVTGVNSSTRSLAWLTVRRHGETVLDLGTGCGVQALLAAGHASRVVAADVNPCAVELAHLNARLNGSEVDVRRGSYFDPVVSEAFDLVVSNPPFVVSPDMEYVFRDSPLGRDEVSRLVVRGAADHLREGGFATILCNWTCRDASDAWHPVEEWVAESGCDALVLAHEPIDVATYAARWNLSLRTDPERFRSTLDRWLEYYEREQIGAIGFGAVILRRRRGSAWVRGVDLPAPTHGHAGEHILRLFAATDRRDELRGDDALLRSRFELVDGHRLEQTLIRRDSEYAVSNISLVLDEGLGIIGAVQPHALHVLFRLDGRRPLGELIDEAVVETGLPHDDVAVQACETARSLYDNGFVVLKG